MPIPPHVAEEMKRLGVAPPTDTPPRLKPPVVTGTYGAPPPRLVQGILGNESGGRHYTPSGRVLTGPPIPGKPANFRALGSMQVMPDAPGLNTRTVGGRSYNLLDPEQNKQAGLAYLQEGLEKAGGDERGAALYYFAGPRGLNRYLKTGRIPAGSDGYTSIADYVQGATSATTGTPGPPAHIKTEIERINGTGPAASLAPTAPTVPDHVRREVEAINRAGTSAPPLPVLPIQRPPTTQPTPALSPPQPTANSGDTTGQHFKLTDKGVEATNEQPNFALPAPKPLPAPVPHDATLDKFNTSDNKRYTNVWQQPRDVGVGMAGASADKGGAVTISPERGMTPATAYKQALYLWATGRGLPVPDAEQFTTEIIARANREGVPLIRDRATGKGWTQTQLNDYFAQGGREIVIDDPQTVGELNERLATHYGDQVLGPSVEPATPDARRMSARIEENKQADGLFRLPFNQSGDALTFDPETSRVIVQGGEELGTSTLRLLANIADAGGFFGFDTNPASRYMRRESHERAAAVAASTAQSAPLSLGEKVFKEAIKSPLPLAKIQLLSKAVGVPVAMALLNAVEEADAGGGAALAAAYEGYLTGKSFELTRLLGPVGNPASQAALGFVQTKARGGSTDDAINAAIGQGLLTIEPKGAHAEQAGRMPNASKTLGLDNPDVHIPANIPDIPAGRVLRRVWLKGRSCLTIFGQSWRRLSTYPKKLRSSVRIRAKSCASTRAQVVMKLWLSQRPAQPRRACPKRPHVNGNIKTSALSVRLRVNLAYRVGVCG